MSDDPTIGADDTKGFWKGDGRQGSAKESGGRRSGTPGTTSSGRTGIRIDLNQPLNPQQPAPKSSPGIKTES